LNNTPDRSIVNVEVKEVRKRGGIPLARLQLRLTTLKREEKTLQPIGEAKKPLIPQFPLAEPAKIFVTSEKPFKTQNPTLSHERNQASTA
jgi:hypothetical protein